MRLHIEIFEPELALTGVVNPVASNAINSIEARTNHMDFEVLIAGATTMYIMMPTFKSTRFLAHE